MGGVMINNHEVFVHNEVPYIVLKNDISIKDLAKEVNLMRWQVNYYNDLRGRTDLKEGELIYLKAKRSKATQDNKIHVVEEGDDLQKISQLYAIKLKKLCKRNNLTEGQVLQVGAKLKLR